MTTVSAADAGPATARIASTSTSTRKGRMRVSPFTARNRSEPGDRETARTGRRAGRRHRGKHDGQQQRGEGAGAAELAARRPLEERHRGGGRARRGQEHDRADAPHPLDEKEEEQRWGRGARGGGGARGA